MFTWEVIRDGITQNFVWVVIGIIFVQIIQKPWDSFWHGGWQVVITKNGKTLLQKKISPAKLKHIRNVPEDKLVFLKGLIAPFEMLNCDLLEDGPDRGLYKENTKEKKFIINLDKNPKPPEQPKKAKL
ncbi:MAG: hypothetical protein ACOYZ8_09110 [Chloroflexota bacterium]